MKFNDNIEDYFENTAQVEQTVLEYWNTLDLPKLLQQQNANHNRFVFYDGPVTANNPLGVHHAWGRTYKDVVQRYKSMQGFLLRYQNGFDTQGLWLEVEAEKEHGFTTKRDIENFGLDNFAQACKSRLYKYAAVQTEQSKRLGQQMDWDNSYYTHTEQNITHIWHFLKEVNRRRWLYKGYQIMPWCVRCGTSLSKHEQADSYRERTHQAAFVRFKLLDSNAYLLVWTTTPWTLPANSAVTYNENLVYGLFANSADEQLYAVMTLDSKLYGLGYTLVQTYPGTHFEGMKYVSPFAALDQQKNLRLVLHWDEVVADEGSGFVHIAPSCGESDNIFGQQHDLDVLHVLDEEGNYLGGYGQYSGYDYQTVGEMVLQDLQQQKLLLLAEPYTHRFPVCWRCGSDLVFRMVDEWFISSDEIRPLMKEAAATVSWYPPHVGKLFNNWLDNMGDWCISRKRFWGLPLPFYSCKACGHLTVVGSKTELFDRMVGANREVELHRPWVDEIQVVCESCGASVQRVREVGDCWLDAGIMPFSTLNYLSNRAYWQQWFPADFVVEMREQTRLWFYATMFMSVTLEGVSPYKFVYSYERVHDKHGMPMHKTAGNAIWLDEALNEMSADALRLLYLSQNPARNLNMDLGLKERYMRPLHTFVNVLKFFTTFAQLDDFMWKGLPTVQGMNRWILSRLDALVITLQNLLDNYQFPKAVAAFEDFLDELSNWYVRRSRSVFWQEVISVEKQQTYQTLYCVLLTLSKLVAPLTPFVGEIVYQQLRNYSTDSLQSVHLESYPQPLGYADSQLDALMNHVRELVQLGLELRNSVGVKVRHPLPEFLVWSSTENTAAALQKFGEELQRELNVKKIRLLSSTDWYISYSLKANYATLGRKVRGKLAQINEFLSHLTAGQVRNWRQQQVLQYVSADLTYKFAPEDLIVIGTPRKGFVSTTRGDCVVFLKHQQSKALLHEGYVRDFVRHIQLHRKSLNLAVDDLPELLVHNAPPFLLQYANVVVKENHLSAMKKANSPLSQEFLVNGNSFTYELVCI